MYIQLMIWTDKEAQSCGWDNLEDTTYAQEIIEEQIHMPAFDFEEKDSIHVEHVEGVAFEGTIGRIVASRLYTNNATLIRCDDGTVWIDEEEYFAL